jgi:parallel beta-helix repeat protein
LDNAGANDTVLVAPGTYHENVVWPNTQGIDLAAEHGPNLTIIDGGPGSPILPDTNSVVLFLSVLDSSTVIRGFTLRNGTGTYDGTRGRKGGGILCKQNAAPLILDNIIRENSSDQGGGIACYYNSSPVIRDNRIMSNLGSGIYCFESSPVIENNNISGNSAGTGGGICCYSSSPTIDDNKIQGNSSYDAGGIYCSNSSPLIVSNRISANSGLYSAGGILSHNNSSPVVNYNAIFDNTTYGVCNWDSSEIINAEYNFWGDETGPYHPSLNPNGLGNMVSDFVDFEPWDPGVSIGERVDVRDRTRGLLHVSPDPFRESAEIRYSLACPGFVRIHVYNLLGQKVTTLVEGPRSSGEHVELWSPTDLAPGVYFIHAVSPMGIETRRCVRLK